MDDTPTNTAGGALRDSVDQYYRPPEHLAAPTARVAVPGGGRSRHLVLGLLLLLAAAPCQFLAFCVGMFLFDPGSTIDEDDYLNGDPSTVDADGVATVLLLSAPVRNTQALIAMVFSAISLFGVVAAVGLMRGKRRGRKFALVWAAMALVFLVVELAVHFVHVFPMYDAIIARLDARCGEACVVLLDAVCGLSTSAGPVGLVMFDLPLFVLPVVMLVATSRKKMIEGCVR